MTDNFVQTFQLEKTAIRGRVVRLGSVLDDILSRHNYPDDVAHLSGETLTMCVMLSSMLKYDGVFTLQTQSEGVVSMLVADVVSNGNIRVCATFKSDDIDSAAWTENRAELLGAGYIAFTVDQGQDMERYQGIVELKDSLTTSMQHYFSQSEQINTGLVMEVGRDNAGKWRATGIMLQEMPEETSKYNQDIRAADEDDWRRTMILLGSVRREEMLDPNLPAEDLLFRLFHEEGVRVYQPLTLQDVCRCNRDRIAAVLGGMPDEDLADSVQDDGNITMTCEFCSRTYKFEPNDLRKGNIHAHE
jgi:molecular chaperone Hsp33